jgi:hypothetical protein
MKKQIAVWFLKYILKPVFKVILIEFGKIFAKYFLDVIKQQMNKWKTTEVENATSEVEKEIITKKWEERINDIEELKTKIDIDIDKVVEQALLDSNDKLKEIENSPDIKKIDTKALLK